MNGVKIQWDGADDDRVDETTLGKDGKLNWVLTLPPLKSVKFGIASMKQATRMV